MNEEEKEVIKETKQVIEKWNDTNWLINYDHKNLEIILNYISKLEKENKKLKAENRILSVKLAEYFSDNNLCEKGCKYCENEKDKE